MRLKDFQIDYRVCKTQELLNLLHSARGIENSESLDEEERKELSKIINALKTELATREHLPNKLERKKIRQEKARKK